MNITKAISHLENGKTIRRKGWENIALIMRPSFELYGIYDFLIYDLVLKTEVRPYIHYRFSAVDILTDDWEIVEEVK
jgi:hypothetical protein